MAQGRLLFCIASLFVLAPGARGAAEAQTHFVQDGKAKLVREEGKAWTRGDGYLECSGTGSYLVAGKAICGGDFHIKARLTILKLAVTAASVSFDRSSNFGFDGGGGRLFVQGPFFCARTRHLAKSADFIQPGRPFLFEMIRRDRTVRCLIDGKTVHTLTSNDELGTLAIRPWRSTMRVYDFSASGDLRDAPKPPEGQTDVFVSGTHGYHSFRIPAIVVTTKGAVLAFAEGRKRTRSDTGDIDTVLRRSTDGGRTWSKLQVIADDGPHTMGNPCPVVDQATGTIWMLNTRNLGSDHEGKIWTRTGQGTRTVWVMKSTDDGLTWSMPVEITKSVKEPQWTWYATGPCTGIQIERGPHKGRLVIPCDHGTGHGRDYKSHIITSDDHGTTWKLGGSTPDTNSSECQVVELVDGRLLLNTRNCFRKTGFRSVSVSEDGGMTWGDVRLDKALPCPGCQGSILRYTARPKFKKNRILFSNPASSRGRVRMTVRLSFDQGKTWPVAKVVHPGSSAYSCLVVLPDLSIGCLYERDGYAKITLARLTLEWLTDGRDALRKTGANSGKRNDP